MPHQSRIMRRIAVSAALAALAAGAAAPAPAGQLWSLTRAYVCLRSETPPEGRTTLSIPTALNDERGRWTLTAADLLGGRTSVNFDLR